MKSIGVILVLALAVVIYGQLNMRSLRFAGIVDARHWLKVANDDFAKSGAVTINLISAVEEMGKVSLEQ